MITSFSVIEFLGNFASSRLFGVVHRDCILDAQNSHSGRGTGRQRISMTSP